MVRDARHGPVLVTAQSAVTALSVSRLSRPSPRSRLCLEGRDVKVSRPCLGSRERGIAALLLSRVTVVSRYRVNGIARGIAIRYRAGHRGPAAVEWKRRCTQPGARSRDLSSVVTQSRLCRDVKLSEEMPSHTARQIATRGLQLPQPVLSCRVSTRPPPPVSLRSSTRHPPPHLALRSSSRLGSSAAP